MGSVISYIDVNSRKIPDYLSLPLIFIGFIFACVSDELDIQQAIIGAVFGFFVFFLIAFVYQKVTKDQGLGGGDIKYLAGIGAFTGIVGVIFVIFFSSIFALIFLIIIVVRNRKINHKKEQGYGVLPYAPFLTFSVFIYIIFKNLLTKFV